MTFGVLTTLTEEQAVARSAEGPDNKGREAALAAVEMVTLGRGDRAMGPGMMAEAERPSVTQMGADSRHRAREAALQMLYQWEVGRMPIDEVCRTFWTGGPAGAPPAGETSAPLQRCWHWESRRIPHNSIR